MKILVILYDLDIGGAQNYTINLMNQFIKLDHNVCLCVLSDNLLLRNRLDKDIELKIWIRKHKFDLNVLKKIRNEIKNGNFDAIISSYILYQKIATLFLSKKPLTIYPIHTTTERNFKNFFLNYITYRFKNKNEIFLTSINNQTKTLTSSYKLKENFFLQVFNGIDVEKFILPPDYFNKILFLNNLNINTNHRIILMVAGYREEKRHIDAIKAFKLIQETYKDITLICVGDNRAKERDILQSYINDKKIQNIKLLLASEAGEVRNYYWISDIFTLTSNKVETFPISALEAMASGLPCVLTNVGGAKDFIIPSLNGLLCKPNDIDDIKNKWLELLKTNNFNKNAIRKVVVENFSIHKSSNEYIQIMKNKLKC